MIGERDDIVNETEYGTLTMRSYDIDGNAINAFYDASDDLIFVLDNTVNQNKPNVLLVINPMGDKNGMRYWLGNTMLIWKRFAQSKIINIKNWILNILGGLCMKTLSMRMLQVTIWLSI